MKRNEGRFPSPSVLCLFGSVLVEELRTFPAPVAHEVHESRYHESDHEESFYEDSETKCESEFLEHR